MKNVLFKTLAKINKAILPSFTKQRLDLARALLRKVTILILDEPTSNLDYESIELFRRSLNSIRQEMNVTIIIVTHNLDNANDADNIIPGLANATFNIRFNNKHSSNSLKIKLNKIFKKITKKNMLRSYPDINDIPN